MGSQNTVFIKGDPLNKEYNAGGAITPGMLIALGSAGTVAAHATSGGICQAMFAKEDDLQGRSITDAYDATTNKVVQCLVCRKGDEINALIADGETISIGDRLVSNGDGYLRKAYVDSSATVVEDYPVAIALEACSLGTSSAADPSNRCIVEIL